MTIETRDFGSIDISESGILEFELPILGFEDQKKYVILYDDEMGASLAWLQSVDKKEVCFIIIDPSIIMPSYSPAISAEVLSALKMNIDEAALRCLLVIPQNASDATVNLKSPLVINPSKKLAAQVVLEEDYPIRASLKALGEVSIC